MTITLDNTWHLSDKYNVSSDLHGDAMPGLLRRIGTRALDLVLPPRCLACGIEIDAAERPVPRLLERAAPAGAALVPLLRLPLPHASLDAPLCAGCAARAAGLRPGRAALRYDGTAAGSSCGFKRGGRLDGVPLFARWMAQAGEELLADADLILPVPLHRWRLLRRGFNQSAVLAQRIARPGPSGPGRRRCCSAIARRRRSRG